MSFGWILNRFFSSSLTSTAASSSASSSSTMSSCWLLSTALPDRLGVPFALSSSLSRSVTAAEAEVDAAAAAAAGFTAARPERLSRRFLLAAEPGTDVEGVAVTRLASFSSFSSASLSMAMLSFCDSLEADAEEGLRAALVLLFDLEALPLAPPPLAPPLLPFEAEGDATMTPSLVCRLDDDALPFACCLPFTLGVAGLLNVFSSPPAPSCSTTTRRAALPSWAGDEARLRLLPCLADLGVVCADMTRF